MSIARPQNRDEFRQYVLTKLGAPVLQVNVAEEQIDIAIEDAFQYFNERSHFLGTERMYLTFRQTPEFIEAFASYRVQETSQTGNGSVPIPGRPTINAPGIVDELTLITPGSGYPSNARPLTYNSTSEVSGEIDITTQDEEDLQTDAGEDIVFATVNQDGEGTGLVVNILPQRTVDMGITTVTVSSGGTKYKEGDIISVTGFNTSTGSAALFQVTKIKTEEPVFSTAPIQSQNNYIVLPDDVVGVTEVMQSRNANYLGILPAGAVFPMLIGGLLGNDAQCGNQGYNLVSYVAMREYLANLEFLFFPPIQYNFNQRTHKLYIDSNSFRTAGYGATYGGLGRIIAIECMVKPSPDVYPDLWNDLWMKKYTVALVKTQWGRNLTKYNQVNLPGGITMNGDQILAQGREDMRQLEERFSMDWADPPLDCVG